MHKKSVLLFVVVSLVVVGMVLGVGGCSVGAGVRVESMESGAVLSPRLPIVVYAASDENTADFYMTDLTMDDLDPGTSLAPITGSLMHVHMFLKPMPGKTPIDRTACSAAIRYAVLAHGSIGLYGGGGFMVPAGSIGKDRFGGSLRDANLRLVAATDGFNDLLSPARCNASFRARLDEPMVRLIRARFNDITAAVRAKDAPATQQPE